MTAVRSAARVGLAAGVLALGACVTAEAGAGGDVPSSPSSTGDGLSGSLTVFAAASLTDTFTELGDLLEAANPDLSVTFSFAGSSALAAQILAGAPADVFAAASTEAMQSVVDSVGVEPVVFARNTLEIAVPPDDPGGVTGLADLARADLVVALCDPQVPCGIAAQRVLAAAGVTAAPDTLEPDVRAVLTKVELGEVDAALVYRTDVIGAGDAVRGISFPEAASGVNDYPILVLDGTANPSAARAFVELVLSAEGQAVLAGAGFDSP